jgi:hypothetical protein
MRYLGLLLLLATCACTRRAPTPASPLVGSDVEFRAEYEVGPKALVVRAFFRNDLAEPVDLHILSIQADLYDPTSPGVLPAKLGIPSGAEKQVSFTFPAAAAQNSSPNFDQSTSPGINLRYDWKSAKGSSSNELNEDAPPQHTWTSYASSPALSLTHDHSSRVLEVEVTSFKVNGKETLKTPLLVKVNPGKQAPLPGLKSQKGSVVEYRYRLLPNTIWQEGYMQF